LALRFIIQEDYSLHMIAIVDCNSFYCSCERLFRPELRERAVVVLSNNDGCIISRTDEAKAAGIGMAAPFFQYKQLIEKNDVTVFSSNYYLYGNMSWRVMETIKQLIGAEQVEVYSVDEAFLSLDHLGNKEVETLVRNIKDTIEKWTGITVSIGVAPTKTLAKLANRLAKKNKRETGCIQVLQTAESIRNALQATQVQHLWGVGRQYAEKLRSLGIETAWDLYQLPEMWTQKHLGGVTGVRLWKELHGQPSISLEKERITKKMITTTRMFGTPVTALSDIKEAVATYTSRAAEKLRRQHSAASLVHVFIVPKDEHPSSYNYRASVSTHRVLSRPTVFTQELLKPAMEMTEMIYEQGRAYKKAGVILGGLVPDSSIQGDLFTPEKSIGRFLMEMVDNINFSMRDDMVKFAASGTRRNWKMRQEYHSPRYTTRWEELYGVR
jgi:DNA polymerase V